MAVPAPTVAATSTDPDWPCVRVMVPEMSPGLIWSGPPIDGIDPTAWQKDPEVRDLVLRVTDRRVPPDKAATAIDEFAAGLTPEEKTDRLVLLFSGAFHTLQEERGDSLEAIRRYAAGQRTMLDRISGHLKQMETQQEGTPDWQRTADELATDRRVLDERRRMLTAVCDRPVLFEQRLGILARAIAPHLPSE